MKAVMISIQPKWCELIANGKKTIEVRKTRPKINTPFKCYIYCTYYYGAGDVIFYSNFNNGLIIGEFVCDKIEKIECCSEQFNMIAKDACMTLKDIMEYCNGKDLYDWHISDLKIYDEPKELSEFSKYGFGGSYYGSYCYDFYCKFYVPSTDYDSPPSCSIGWDCGITRPPQSWQYCGELKEKSNG